MVKRHLQLSGLLMFLFLAACQPPLVTPVPVTIAPTSTFMPSPTPLPTETPTSEPSATPRPLGCAEISGRLEDFQVEDKQLSSKAMDVKVYLPPCYGQDVSTKYPVLYLIHGQSFTNDQWVRLGVPETLDAWFVAGKYKPFIVVFPNDEYNLQDWSQSNFDDFFSAALIPWVDGHYQTCTQRACRAVGGLSRGATWAVVLGLNDWQLFGAFGAHSLPDVPFVEANVRDRFKEMAAADGHARVYLDTGSEDGHHLKAEMFEGYLKKYGITHTWTVFPGGHNEEYWQSHLTDYLNWYASLWQAR
ncbi:MAG: hypothetical protein LWX83_12090 [Anaerolineae bacterium]|nr:hypothetical protein [Anaerolineae bacterium]